MKRFSWLLCIVCFSLPLSGCGAKDGGAKDEGTAAPAADAAATADDAAASSEDAGSATAEEAATE